MTGAAGFIGSHLSESLVEEGYQVIGIDNFSDYYPRKLKQRNLSRLQKERRFLFTEADVARDDLSRIIRDVDYVFHLAAQPGVRGSWGSSFSVYLRDNILATQRLLEAAKGTRVKRFIYASSSSIYGDSERLPTPETATPAPVSPYGVSKLAAEHLCNAYLKNHGIRTVILRYFTVYGPRQRPDMAFSIFISRIASGKQIVVYGDGRQKRDFTYVDDAVSATMASMEAPLGSVYNVGGGRAVTLNKVIFLIESILGRRATIRHVSRAQGDVRSTTADISRISRDLGYRASTSLEEGIGRQIRNATRIG